VAEVDGPRSGLALLAGLEESLPGNHRLAAVRAELSGRAGDIDLARAAYRAAIGLCTNDIERADLTNVSTRYDPAWPPPVDRPLTHPEGHSGHKAVRTCQSSGNRTTS